MWLKKATAALTDQPLFSYVVIEAQINSQGSLALVFF